MSNPITDELLHELVALGRKRCASESSWDAPIVPPDPPDWDSDRRKMLAKQIHAFGGADNLLNHYVELLARCQQLVDFFTSNVGYDDEWPITILGESEEAEILVQRVVHRLACATGSLCEV